MVFCFLFFTQGFFFKLVQRIDFRVGTAAALSEREGVMVASEEGDA